MEEKLLGFAFGVMMAVQGVVGSLSAVLLGMIHDATMEYRKGYLFVLGLHIHF